MPNVYIGDVEIATINEVSPTQEKTTEEIDALGLEDPVVSEMDPGLETLNIPVTLLKQVHSEDKSVQEQRKDVKSLLRRLAGENAFDYLDWAGWLSIEEVNVPYDEDQRNIITGTISAKYLPHGEYQLGEKVKSPVTPNDFNINRPGVVSLPAFVDNVRIQNPANKDFESLSPIATETGEGGNFDLYEVSEWGHANNSTQYGNDANKVLDLNATKLESTELTAQNARVYPISDSSIGKRVPSGRYTAVVRAKDANQVTDDLEIAIEAYDGSSWNEIHKKNVTLTSQYNTYKLSNKTLNHNTYTEYKIKLTKRTSNNNTIDIDGAYLKPEYTPEILFDVEAGRTLDKNVSAWWTFESNDPQKALDYSVNGHDIDIGDVNKSSDSVFGNHSLEFDNDAVIADGTEYVDTSGTFSLSTWLKPVSDGGGFDCAISKSNRNSGFSVIQASTNEAHLLEIWDGEGDSTTIEVDTPFNEWTHVAMVYDGSQLITYRNGSQVDATTQEFTPNRSLPLGLGAGDEESQPGEYNGKLDDVRFFASAIDSDEISFIYNNPGELFDPVESINVPDRSNQVKVFDDNGSSNGNDWTKVYSEDHNFNGNLVAQNGFIRVSPQGDKTGDSAMIKVEYRYNDEWVTLFNKDWNINGIDSVSVLKLTPEIVRFYINGQGWNSTISVKRGDRFFTIESEELDTDHKLVFDNTAEWVSNVDNVSTGTHGNYSQTFTLDSDNSYAMAGVDNVISFVASADSNATNSYWINESDASELRVNGTDGLIKIGAIPFPEGKNLLTQAEDGTLGAGANENYWEMPLGTSGNLNEFAGDIGGFTEDTSNSKLTHSDDTSDYIVLKSLRFGESIADNNHYRLQAVASDTSGDEKMNILLCKPQGDNSTNSSSTTGYRVEYIYGNEVLQIFDTNGNDKLASTAFTAAYGTAYNLEVEFYPSSGDIDIYIWEDGTGKPGSPELSITDSSYSSGTVGFGAVGSVDITSFSVNAEETTSAEDSAVVVPSNNISQESAYYQFTAGQDVPLGTYLLASRAKVTNVNSEYGHIVENATDDANIAIESNLTFNQGGFNEGSFGGATFDESTDYLYNIVEVRLTEDDDGDTINFGIVSSDTVTSHAVVDEFILVPVSLLNSNRMGPQDIAHNALHPHNTDRVLREK